MLVVPKLETYNIPGHVLQATSKEGASSLDKVTGIAHNPDQSIFGLYAMNRPCDEMACMSMRIRPVLHHSIMSYDSEVIHWLI